MSGRAKSISQTSFAPFSGNLPHSRDSATAMEAAGDPPADVDPAQLGADVADDAPTATGDDPEILGATEPPTKRKKTEQATAWGALCE